MYPPFDPFPYQKLRPSKGNRPNKIIFEKKEDVKLLKERKKEEEE
jgi:hypothetical protein